MVRLNRLLCKYIDYSKKGYVTIGNLIEISIIVLIAAPLFIYSLYMGVCLLFGYYTIPVIPDLPAVPPINIFEMCAAILGSALILLIVVVFAYISFNYVANIKITQCPIKDKNKPTNSNDATKISEQVEQ